MLTVTVNDAEEARVCAKVLQFYADLLGAPPTVAEEEAVAEEVVQKRKRRTKAEMETERQAVAAVAVEAMPAPETVEADLYSGLKAIAKPAPEVEELIDREALLTETRQRATSPGGREWLVGKVLCNSRYPKISDVPNSVLRVALAEARVAA